MKTGANIQTGGGHPKDSAESRDGLSDLPTPEHLKIQLTKIGFEFTAIDMSEGGQLWKVSMLPGQAQNWDRRVYVLHLMATALTELAPALTIEDIGVNIAAEHITVGVFFEGTRKGRVLVGMDQVILNSAT